EEVDEGVDAAGGDRALGVGARLGLVVLLDHDLRAVHLGHVGDVAVGAAVPDGDVADLGFAVDLHSRLLGGVIPVLGVAPGDAFVGVGELDAEPVIDPPGGEGRALARPEIPGIAHVGAALVGVVVLDRAFAGFIAGRGLRGLGGSG